jgi:hypothetical protein
VGARRWVGRCRVLADKELFTMSSFSGVRDLICKSEVPATIPFGKSSALAALLQYDLVTAHFKDELLVLLISTVEQSCQRCQIHKTQNQFQQLVIAKTTTIVNSKKFRLQQRRRIHYFCTSLERYSSSSSSIVLLLLLQQV